MLGAIMTDAQSAPSTTPITSREDKESDLEVSNATPLQTNNWGEKSKKESDGNQAMPSSPVTNKEDEKPNNESDGEQQKQESRAMPSAIMTNAQSAPSTTPVTSEEDKECHPEVAHATPPPNNEREKSENKSDGSQAIPSLPVTNKIDEKPNNESDKKQPKQESHAMPSAIMTNARSAPNTTPVTIQEDQKIDPEVAHATSPLTNNERERSENESHGNQAMPSLPVTKKEDEKPNNESDEEQPKQESHAMPSAIMTGAQSAPSPTPVTSEEDKESHPEVAHATPAPTNNEREMSENESDGNQAMPSSPVTNKEDEKPDNDSDEQPKQESQAMPSAIMTDAQSSQSTTPVTTEEDKESHREVAHATPPPTNNEREKSENQSDGNQAMPSSPVTNKEHEKPSNESDEEQPKQESHAMPSTSMTDAQSAPNTTPVTSEEHKESDPEVAHAMPPPTHNKRDKSKNESGGNQASPSSPVTNKEDEKPNNESDGEHTRRPLASPVLSNLDDHNIPNHESDGEQPMQVRPPVTGPVLSSLDHHNIYPPSKNSPSLPRELPERTKNQTRHPTFSRRGWSPPVLHYSSPITAHAHSTMEDQNKGGEEKIGKRKRLSTKQNTLENETSWSPGTGRMGKKLRAANPQPIAHPAIAHHMFSKSHPALNPPVMHHHKRISNVVSPPMMNYQIPHPWTRPYLPPRPHVPAQGAETPGPKGKSLLVKLTLPSSNVSLGVILNTCAAFGLPELKGVERSSPADHQIPKDFQKNCCIFSLESQAIGYVEPKTAHQCVTLIAASREGCGSQLKVGLVQKSKTEAQPDPPQGTKVLTKSKVAQVHPIPQGRSQLVKLTLPPPNVSLGILLDTCTIFGLPELKDVEINSPMKHQIPKDFQKNCYILSIESQAIGYVEPKTAHQCATLIAKSREECGSQTKVLLVQKSKTEAQIRPPQVTKVLPEPTGAHGHPIPKGRSQLVKLTLPPPNVSLGILLDICATFGLPELKDVKTNSPADHQIPTEFQRNCCILSLESQAIGYVEPKTAQQCAKLIALCQEERGSQMKVVLVQKSKTEVQPNPTQGTQILAESRGDHGHPIPKGRSQMVKLTLPPPNVSLGILLDICAIFGLPELKDVETNSPADHQIPTEFQRNCCILSLESQAIGYVEPKTAQQCAKLIALCQEERGSQMQVVLVQKSKTEVQPNLTQGTKILAESRGGRVHVIPQGRSQLVKLTLPPPNVSLGILLDTCTTFCLPELKDVETNSPMNPQIPKEFQSNCCILSLESQVIGYVEPKTAHQCASLIAMCRKEGGSQVKVMLVQKSKTEAQPEPPAPQAYMPRVHGDRHVRVTKKAQMPAHGRSLLVNLKLPPPNASLGILLDTCTTFGLPELKDVDINSPINSQIPRDFQKNCCILSIESQAIGYVEPKTAQQCASLISTSREGCGSQVKVMLVQKSKIETQTNPPKDKQVAEPTGGT